MTVLGLECKLAHIKSRNELLLLLLRGLLVNGLLGQRAGCLGPLVFVISVYVIVCNCLSNHGARDYCTESKDWGISTTVKTSGGEGSSTCQGGFAQAVIVCVFSWHMGV